MCSKFIPPDAGERDGDREDAGPGRKALVDFALLDGHHGKVDLDRDSDGLAHQFDGAVDAAQVVDHVAEVILRAHLNLRHTAARQFANRLQKRRHRVLQDSGALLEFVQSLDVGARRALGEDLLFDGFQFHLQRIVGRELAINNGVHQRVQQEPRAGLQQLRLAFAAFAHVEEAQLAAAANRQHIVAADEDIALPYVEGVGVIGVPLDPWRELLILMAVGRLPKGRSPKSSRMRLDIATH